MQDSSQSPHELSEDLALGEQAICKNQIAQQGNDDQKKRRRLCAEESFEELEQQSTIPTLTKKRRRRLEKPTPEGTNHPIEKLLDVKQDDEGNIEIQVCWAPSWVPIKKLRGEVYKAAKELVNKKFGEGVGTATSER